MVEYSTEPRRTDESDKLKFLLTYIVTYRLTLARYFACFQKPSLFLFVRIFSGLLERFRIIFKFAPADCYKHLHDKSASKDVLLFLFSLQDIFLSKKIRLRKKSE